MITLALPCSTYGSNGSCHLQYICSRELTVKPGAVGITVALLWFSHQQRAVDTAMVHHLHTEWPGLCRLCRHPACTSTMSSVLALLRECRAVGGGCLAACHTR